MDFFQSQEESKFNQLKSEMRLAPFSSLRSSSVSEFTSAGLKFNNFLDSNFGPEVKWENSVAAILLYQWTIHDLDEIVKTGHRPKGAEIEEFFKNYYKKYDDLVRILESIWHNDKNVLTQQEEKQLVSYLSISSPEFFQDFITNCALYDMCFYHHNKEIIKEAMGRFKKDIPFFLKWLGEKNLALSCLLADTIPGGEHKNFSSYNHIAINRFFAEEVLNNIPVEHWTPEMVCGLGTAIFFKDIPPSYFVKYARALETGNETQVANRISSFLNFLSGKTAEKQSLGGSSIYSYVDKNEDWMVALSKLFVQLKTPEGIKQAAEYLNLEKNADFVEKVKGKLSVEEMEKLVKICANSPAAIRQVYSIQNKEGKPLLWSLYEKGKLTKEEMEQVLKQAIRDKKIDFLMGNKTSHFSSEFPAYKELKEFFATKSSAMGTRFLNSFSWQGVGAETQTGILHDFVNSNAIYLHYCQKLGLANELAKGKHYYKLLSFFYGDNADTNSTPKALFSEQHLKELWLHKDEMGKTPWHYICEDKEKIFFQKRFKELTPLFLSACQLPDKFGKTPLDYAQNDIKFMRYLTEKMPQLDKVYAEKGVHTEYKPVERKVVQPVTPVAPAPAQPVVQKTKPVLTEEEQLQQMQTGLEYAIGHKQNLIIQGPHRAFGLTCDVGKEVHSDEAYRQDILEHIQKLISTPISQSLIIRGEHRWKTFGGGEVNELSISPLSGNAQSMPRLYCKKELFKKEGKTLAVTNTREANKKDLKTQTIWVAVKKGDKRNQTEVGHQAENIGFQNDGQRYDGVRKINNLPWFVVDVSGNAPLLKILSNNPRQ